MKKLLIVAAVVAAFIVAAAAIFVGLNAAYPVQVATNLGMARNYVVSWSAPPGTTTTETNAAYYSGSGAPAPSGAVETPVSNAAGGDWPSYNRTLTSDRYSPLSEINTHTVGKLKVLCTYDVGSYSAFETGLIMVNNALIGTTQFDIFSLDPATCAENWRTHEDYALRLLGKRKTSSQRTSIASVIPFPRFGE